MTSANVTKYRIELDGKVVGEHRQHHYCHTRWHRLFKFVPLYKHTITPYGEDEDEAPWEGKTQNLWEFLKNINSVSDMKRMVAHIEKQNTILKEWSEKFGNSDKELNLKTLNSISYSPL